MSYLYVYMCVLLHMRLKYIVITSHYVQMRTVCVFTVYGVLFLILFLSQVRALHGVPALVRLFSSDNQEVLRYATGAMRNLIYENTDNKVVLIDAGGVTRLISILSEPDEELRKTITGGLTAAYERNKRCLPVFNSFSQSWCC